MKRLILISAIAAALACTNANAKPGVNLARRVLLGTNFGKSLISSNSVRALNGLAGCCAFGTAAAACEASSSNSENGGDQNSKQDSQENTSSADSEGVVAPIGVATAAAVAAIAHEMEADEAETRVANIEAQKAAVEAQLAESKEEVTRIATELAESNAAISTKTETADAESARISALEAQLAESRVYQAELEAAKVAIQEAAKKQMEELQLQASKEEAAKLAAAQEEATRQIEALKLQATEDQKTAINRALDTAKAQEAVARANARKAAYAAAKAAEEAKREASWSNRASKAWNGSKAQRLGSATLSLPGRACNAAGNKLDQFNPGWGTRIVNQMSSDLNNATGYFFKGINGIASTPNAVKSGLSSGINKLRNLRRPATPVSTQSETK